MKELIVNADDFGRSPGVNRGILDAHHKGIVTSTTVMINSPDAPDAIEAALNTAPALGLGLHLNLVAGQPVSPPAAIPSLVNADGQFYPIMEWPARMDAIAPDDFATEIGAQIERFIELAGRLPDHLDAHYHATYLHPAALRIMLETAAGYRLPLRHVPIDDPAPRVIAMLRALAPTLPHDTAARLVEQLHAALAESPAPFWPARSEAGFFSERATLGELLVILTTLPDDSITELMCHPGYAEDGPPGSTYTIQREAELNHLTHPATRECVAAEQIKLITFGDLLR